MSTQPTKLQRWLDLVAFLAARRFPVSTEDLWAGVPAYAAGLDGGDKERESVRRMFERDKDELRAAGIPIETVTFTVMEGGDESHGYRLRSRDFHLPYLKLIGEERPAGAGSGQAFELRVAEAGAALDGLREVASLPGFPLRRQARSAFRKLAFDLDPDALAMSPVVLAEDVEAIASADTMRLLADALLARKRVRCVYHSMARDERAERSLRPYGLLFQHGRWYLIAFAEDRDDVRMFRVGRLSDVSVEKKRPGTPDYEIPADFDLRAFAGRSAWELDEGQKPLRALVRFRFPRSLWAERNGHGLFVEEAEDGSQLRAFTVHRADPFLRWILSLGGDARIAEPPDLTAAFEGMLGAVADRYRDAEPDE